MLAIVHARIEQARYQAGPLPYPELERMRSLYATYQDDIRSIEYEFTTIINLKGASWPPAD